MKSWKVFWGAVAVLFGLAILGWGANTSTFAPASDKAPLAEYVQPGSLFASALQPLAQLAQARRAERARTDAAWSARIDPALNQDRINFVIYLYGDTYEPSPLKTEVTKTGSYTLVSLNLKTGLYNKITVSRDFHSPEVARHKTGDPGIINPSTRIGEAMEAGGFDFARAVIENATGLSADFQFKVPDTFVSNLVDLLGGVDVEVPADIALYEFYVDGIGYAARDYRAGTWRMDGLTALGYAKAMPKGEYTQDTERVLRSQAVLDAAMVRLRQELNSNDAFTLVPKLFELGMSSRGAQSACDEAISQVRNEPKSPLKDCFAPNGARNDSGIETDFDFRNLFDASVSRVARNFVYAFAHYGFDLGFPHPAEGLYVSAEYQGGGGGWRIPPGDMLIAIDGDPRGDPVRDYWGAVRRFVRGKLNAVDSRQ